MTASPPPFIAACIQTSATPDIATNIQAASDLVRAAHAKGAKLVLMPENVAMMDFGRPNILAKSFPEDKHPALPAFSALAKELSLWLHGGSLQILLDDQMVANRTYVFSPAGEVAAWYDKIHMFDVDLDGGESYRESQTFKPGQRAVVAKTDFGGLGLAICYDLRFPHLFRTLSKAGASMLCAPAAFTRQTGQAHWHVLQRARAIENGAYMLSPAQCGDHAGGRQTYGHALIISPWGVVLADAGDQPGFITATIDPGEVIAARKKIPALTHDRPFTLV
ncbi:MAG: carbon-nitrogen hydrolase family protein [Alphaproteobacteria bacterium]|nr:carbon-nitrogen hydrolase family protein [Alphaproteobacteria bacterium]